MSTRYLIAALLMTSACVAQADVLPASAPTGQSTFLSGWTGANGTSVVNSGSLVGGVSYGSDSANLVKALYDKASASQAGGEVNLSVSQGIEGTYVLGTSNALMAAMLGNGMSVVNTADGKKVLAGSNGSAPAASSGGSAPAPAGSSGAAAPAASSGGSAPAAAAPVLAATPAPAETATSVGGAADAVPVPVAAGSAVSGALVPTVVTPLPAQGTLAEAADAAEVPEPSSIALMMAGMMGALAIGRRRRRN